jgi:hypothetical protein
MKNQFFLFLFIGSILTNMTLAQSVIPYLPMQNSFGGAAVADVSTFEPSLGNFTLEVTASSLGTPVSIAMLDVSYTPTTSTTLRFVQYDGKVYIYEGGEYKETQTPTTSITYGGSNLLQNPSFDTGTTANAGTSNWNAYNASKTLDWANAGSGSCRITYKVTGTYGLLLRQPFGYLTQQFSAGVIKPNTYYQISYYVRVNATGQDGAIYALEFGGAEFGTDYGTGAGHTMDASTSFTKKTFVVKTNASVEAGNPSWFCFHRTNSGNYYEWYDDFSLIEGTPTLGISGAASASYAAGVVAAPEITPDYAEGDAFDMYPYYLVNPNFDANTSGWTKTTNGTLAYSTAAKGDETLLPLNDGKLQVWGISNTGNVSQTISNLPNGKYSFKAAVYGENVVENGLYLFGNLAQTVIPTSVSTTNAYFTVENAIVADGNLEIGLKLTTAGTSLVALDKVSLYYYGPDYQAQADALLAQIVTYRPLFERPQDASVKAHFAADTLAAYNAATANPLVEANLNSTAAAMAAYLTTVNASIAAYVTLDNFLNRTENYTLGYYTDFSGYSTYNTAVTAARTAYSNGTVADADIPTLIANLKNAETTCLFSDGATNQTTLVTNPTFDSNITGWTSTTGAQNKKIVSSLTGDFTGNGYENWNGSAFTGKMYQTLSNLPDGRYRLKTAVYANGIQENSMYLYANDAQTPITISGTPTFYMVDVNVISGSLEIGIQMATAAANWVAIDNVQLYRLGEAIFLLSDKATLPFSSRQKIKKFVVSGININNDVTLTAPSGIALNPTTITATDLVNDGVEITATFDGATSIASDNIVITTSGGNTVNIAVSADPTYHANLLYGWDANEQTGITPNEAGWIATGETIATWGGAQAGPDKAEAYFRTDAVSNYAFLSISTKNSTVITYAYPVYLTANMSYLFTGKNWRRNGQQASGESNVTYAISTTPDANGTILATQTQYCNAAEYFDYGFKFTAPSTDVYYLIRYAERTTSAYADGSADLNLVAIQDYVVPATGTASDYTTVGSVDPSTYYDVVFNDGSQLSGASALPVNGVVKVVKTFDTDKWYPIGFPFEIKSVSIKVSGSEAVDGAVFTGTGNVPNAAELDAFNSNLAGHESENYYLAQYNGTSDCFTFTGTWAANNAYVIEIPQEGGAFDGASQVEVTFTAVANTTLTSEPTYTVADGYALTINPNLINASALTGVNYYYEFDLSNQHFDRNNSGGSTLSANLKPFEALVTYKGADSGSALRSSIGIGATETPVALPAVITKDPVVRTEYYNLQGIRYSISQRNRISAGTPYIVKEVHQSGKVTSKVISDE